METDSEKSQKKKKKKKKKRIRQRNHANELPECSVESGVGEHANEVAQLWGFWEARPIRRIISSAHEIGFN